MSLVKAFFVKVNDQMELYDYPSLKTKVKEIIKEHSNPIFVFYFPLISYTFHVLYDVENDRIGPFYDLFIENDYSVPEYPPLFFCGFDLEMKSYKPDIYIFPYVKIDDFYKRDLINNIKKEGKFYKTQINFSGHVINIKIEAKTEHTKKLFREYLQESPLFRIENFKKYKVLNPKEVDLIVDVEDEILEKNFYPFSFSSE